AMALALCVAVAACATTPKNPPTTYLVFFPPHSALLVPNAARTLNKVAADANGHAAVVEVSGPTAKRTSRRKPTLAEQRTVAVEHALVAAGVPEERMRRVPAKPSRKQDPAEEPVQVRLAIKPTV
ncbi:MAG TPA: OmpA family protein, partial [Rhizomicrobium sp.]